MRSLGNGAPIFFGTFPSPRGLLRAVAFHQSRAGTSELARRSGFSLGRGKLRVFSRIEHATLYVFVVHLRALQEPEPLPLARASRPPKRFQFTFLQCGKPTSARPPCPWTNTHSGALVGPPSRNR